MNKGATKVKILRLILGYVELYLIFPIWEGGETGSKQPLRNKLYSAGPSFLLALLGNGGPSKGLAKSNAVYLQGIDSKWRSSGKVFSWNIVLRSPSNSKSWEKFIKHKQQQSWCLRRPWKGRKPVDIQQNNTQETRLYPFARLQCAKRKACVQAPYQVVPLLFPVVVEAFVTGQKRWKQAHYN